MMHTLVRRLHREEQGYAIVVAMLLLAIMMVSLVVALNAGQAALRESDFGVKWARTLTVAESGIDDAVVTLTANRTATSDCPLGGGVGCDVDDGEYQVSWTTATDGSMTVTSTGFYPSVAAAKYTRTVQVLLEPEPSFDYALFAEDNLEVKNNQVITGSIYSTGSVIVGANTIVCGSIVSASGTVTMNNGTSTVTDYAAKGCSGEEADIWVGGSINASATTTIAGDAKASAPTGTACNPASTSYEITGGSVAGSATACGRITSSSALSQPGTSSTPPTVESLPGYTFSPANYPSLTCYGGVGTCNEGNTSATAVSNFDVYKEANELSLSGQFAIWQTSPSQSTVLDLEGITIGGDLTIVTNAPISFGLTSTIGSVGNLDRTVVIVSTYVPPTGTSCTTNGGDCSIYSANKIEFYQGDLDDPNDGIAALVYTPGKLAVKNSGSAADGALYAGSMDIKNGFDINYSARIAAILGFGTGLSPTLWQELSD